MTTLVADTNNNNLSEPIPGKLSNGKVLNTEPEATSTKTLPNEESFLEIFAKLGDDELIRGETPANLEQRCLELCQSYIGGSWLGAKDVEHVEVKRITGGLTNQLYKVVLKDSVLRVSNGVYPDEPSVVAVKLYQEKHMKNYSEQDAERLNDIIVLTIMSEAGLSPKVYGIFGDGFIQAFVEVSLNNVKAELW